MSMVRRCWARFVAVALVSGTVLGTLVPTASADPVEPVVSRVSGRCLAVDGGSSAPGTGLSVATCDGSVAQLWTLHEVRGGNDGEGALSSFGGTRCLDVRGGRGVVGARLEIEPCGRPNGVQSQHWFELPNGMLLRQDDTGGECVGTYRSLASAGTPLELQTCDGRLGSLWRAKPYLTDEQNPTPPYPGSLRAADLTCSSVTFSWVGGADESRVYGGDVYHDGRYLQTVPGAAGGLRTSVDLALVPGVKWHLTVRTRDAAGNVSKPSDALTVTPPPCAPDRKPPTQPQGLTATATGAGIRLGWVASVDADGVRSYLVQRDGVTVGRLAGTPTVAAETRFLDSGLPPGPVHGYRVLARDPQGNTSLPSETVTASAAVACVVCAVRPVAADDDLPWGLVTLPDGSVLYGRRDAGRLVLLDPRSGRQTVVSGALPRVSATGDGGLLGLAVSPTFAGDHWLYVMHSTSTDNRIVRVRLNGTSLDPGSEQVLVSGIPRGTYRNGGRLRFGPDGKLYAGTGDAMTPGSAQDLSVLAGKVLRLDPDGSVPADNPFGTYVWSSGHGNPQGLAFDAAGRLWEQEPGSSPTAMDETNLVVKAANYGWPACEGTVGRCSPAYLTAPAATYPAHLGSCSGLAVVGDALFLACARGARLYRSTVSGTSLSAPDSYLAGTYGRLRTVEPAADGGLWVTTTTRGDSDATPGNSDEKLLRVALG